MMERSGLVTLDGRPVTLLGPALQVGDQAPEFKVVDADFRGVTLNNFRDKIKLISVVPSLDTPVCELQTMRFNQEAEQFPPQVVVLTISMDLPFAQTRFCGAKNINRVHALSDYKYRSFGYSYGVMVKELMLLSRAVFLLDRENIIRYREICHELKEHPHYYEVLQALKAVC